MLSGIGRSVFRQSDLMKEAVCATEFYPPCLSYVPLRRRGCFFARRPRVSLDTGCAPVNL